MPAPARTPGQHGSAARRGEEGQDRRLHQRHRAGRARRRSSSTSTCSRCRTRSRPTTASSRTRSSRSSTPAPARSTSTSSSGSQSVFTRDVSMGGNAFTEAVQKELNLPYESAEQLKKGQDVDGATYEDARAVLRAMTDNVLLEVEKTFDFFKATASSDRIDRIMLCGGASRVEGFAESLRERFATEVEQFDPFRQVACDPKKVGIDNLDDYGAGRARWRWASRCARWVTDDSHQPPRHRTPRRQGGGARLPGRPEDDGHRQPDAGADRRRRRLALLGARPASRRRSPARSKRRSAKKRACRKSSSRSRNSRTAARCSKRASR